MSMAPTVATPATGAVASPVVSDVGKAARFVGLGLPALPSLPGLASHGQPRVSSFCECLRTCTTAWYIHVTSTTLHELDPKCFLSGKRLARNVVAMAAGEPAAPLADNAELTEFINALKQEWDRVEDKYAVTTLAVAATLGMWSAGGVVSAIDKLPVVPGLMEVVGIGYSGWFAYKNLLFKPDRKAFFAKVRNIYEDIISG
ncbi:unnamed protein product [Alopecurus aequalis]